MKLFKSLVVLSFVAFFFFLVNYILHSIFTLGITMIWSQRIDNFSYPVDYGQALRMTTVLNLALVVPVLIALSLRLNKYFTKWFRAKPLPFYIVLVVNSFAISFVVLPFLLGMLSQVLP